MHSLKQIEGIEVFIQKAMIKFFFYFRRERKYFSDELKAYGIGH